MSDDELVPYDLSSPAPVKMEIQPGWAERFKNLLPCSQPPGLPLQVANPHRVGACAECGAYRTDGRPPYIHKDGCSREGDPQLDRWLAEQRTADHGGPVLYCAEHDHAVKGARA